MPNVEIKGIPTIRFVVTYENFARSLRNRCYCLEDSEDKCPAGALNLVACSSAQNVEVIASSPYFYTNPTLLNQSHLEMKHFSLDQYGTILDIEPVRKHRVFEKQQPHSNCNYLINCFASSSICLTTYLYNIQWMDQTIVFLKKIN